MYDKVEHIKEKSCSPPSMKEAKAQCKHINHIQHGVNSNSREKNQKTKKNKHNDGKDGLSKGLDVFRSLSLSLSNLNLDQPSPYKYGSNEINHEGHCEQKTTVTPLGTFKHTLEREFLGILILFKTHKEALQRINFCIKIQQHFEAKKQHQDKPTRYLKNFYNK